MKNLAGNPQCDSDIVRELLAANIMIVPQERSTHEVAASFHGELAGWSFRRAWYYWVATPIHPNPGLPRSNARELYALTKDARAGGDCTSPHPDTQLDWFEVNTGRKIVLDPNGEQLAQFQKFNLAHNDYKFVASIDEETLLDDTGTAVIPVVTCYHIDTQEALNAFVSQIR